MPETTSPDEIGWPASGGEPVTEPLCEANIDWFMEMNACPHCGGRDFQSLQLLYAIQQCTDGNFSAPEYDYETRTIKVVCQSCGKRIWAGEDYETYFLPAEIDEEGTP
jgi:hypothetical protein